MSQTEREERQIRNEMMHQQLVDKCEIEYLSFSADQALREIEVFGEAGINTPSFRLIKRSTPERVLSAWRRASGQLGSLSVIHPNLWLCQKAAKTANKHGWTYDELMTLLFAQDDK